MSNLKHSDALLRLKPGSWVMACDTARGVPSVGGVRTFPPGARLRVKHSTGDLLWTLAEDGETVTFDRKEMAALEAVRKEP